MTSEAGGGPSDAEHLAVDDWFLRRGLTAMLPWKRAAPLVWRDAMPLLVLLYLLALAPETFDADQRSFVGLALLAAHVIVPWLLSNLRQGQRPFAIPARVGKFELALFVLGPISYTWWSEELQVGNGWLGDNETSLAAKLVLFAVVAALILVAQLVLIGLVRLVAGSGAVALAKWLFRELIGMLDSASAALARALPLLLGVVTFFFFTAEVWQSVGRLHGVTYSLVLLSFIGLGATFLSSRRQLDLDALRRFQEPDELYAALERCDAPFDSFEDARGLVGDCPLGIRQRFNLRLVAVLSRLIVAVVIATGVGLFFVAVGVLAIDAESVKTWTAHEATELFSIEVGRNTWLLSWEHLRVAGFLATFTGFYFAVVSTTDPIFREGITDTAEDLVRSACAVRVLSLARENSSA